MFDGRSDRLYTEEDLPAPLNYYGVTKYQGEQAVASICRNYAIVRVVVVYGKALPGQHGNVLQLVKNRLEAGQEIRVVADQYRTPTWVEDIAPTEWNGLCIPMIPVFIISVARNIFLLQKWHTV